MIPAGIVPNGGINGVLVRLAATRIAIAGPTDLLEDLPVPDPGGKAVAGLVVFKQAVRAMMTAVK